MIVALLLGARGKRRVSEKEHLPCSRSANDQLSYPRGEVF
jgi:hypothetical protein